ncbi:MAG: NAD(P)H-binding protein [bacterium]|nr:NAD(P)H-binding protein [bacterium]
MNLDSHPDSGRVLILGGTGFVGRRLISELSSRNIPVRVLARNREKAASRLKESEALEIVQGDLLDKGSLESVFADVHTVFYLVHSMGGRTVFQNLEYAEKDKRAARNFMAAAEGAGVKRVIYLGALGEKGENLSEHLQSRAQVEEILSSSKAIAPTILRAAIIIGAGGASFEMLRYLVERLPIMGCPKWVDTRIQPIAINDVIAYLVGCLLNPETAGKTFDIGGPEILTYREMMHQYAKARGLRKRIIVRVPFLTPLISVYWVDLVTPIPSGIAHPLIEGLKNEVICKESTIGQYVPIELTSYQEAVRIAHSEQTSGPGVK